MSNKEKMQWKYQRYMQDYLATISSVDDNVGRVLDYLEETGLIKNTIVVILLIKDFILVSMVGLIKDLSTISHLKHHF